MQLHGNFCSQCRVIGVGHAAGATPLLELAGLLPYNQAKASLADCCQLQNRASRQPAAAMEGMHP
jgi:hypothetical protein